MCAPVFPETPLPPALAAEFPPAATTRPRISAAAGRTGDWESRSLDWASRRTDRAVAMRRLGGAGVHGIAGLVWSAREQVGLLRMGVHR
jgi:hypothetical protein